MVRATREEIQEYLARVPNAHGSWVDVCYALGMPLVGLDRFVQTMQTDSTSPLKMMEDSRLSKEIVKLNGVFGDLSGGEKGNGRVVVRLNAVMTMSEASRVTSLVGNFCQPDIRANGRFGKNGHIVMNGVRRCTAGYQVSKIPVGATIVEVGPDVKNWITDTSAPDWIVDGKECYTGARPRISQRDVVRTQWHALAVRMQDSSIDVSSETIRTRAGQVLKSYDTIFPNKRIEDVDARGEYILSNDSNYDIKFSDMPKIMVACGARGWYGTMLRIKGLTRYSKMDTGSLDLSGVNYRVDWKKRRVDFRHPKCNAFGYSHDVYELMKYEEYNGYVWTSDAANYVYAKGPETNDELLFFTVVRVVKTLYLVQPSYVENPESGRMRIKSVWAVGGWDGGQPTKFEPIEFHVDPLAFSKVYEKRRALDSKGDFSNTLTFVRSTNVRMWLNGTPVGTNKRIESALAEATAVAIEVLVSQSRLRTMMVFGEAMQEYKLAVEKGNWLYRLLESVIDFKNLCGTVVAPVARVWGSVRGAVADFALSSLSGLTVVVGVVKPHVRMTDMGRVHNLRITDGDPDRLCTCEYDREVSSARAVDEGKKDFDIMTVRCRYCVDVLLPSTAISSGTDTSSTLCTESSTSDDVSSVASDFTEPEEVYVSEEDAEKGWRKKELENRPERRAMEEAMETEVYLKNALMTEIRIDARRISAAKCLGTKEILQFASARVQHAMVRFVNGRCIETLGAQITEFSAIFDVNRGKFHTVKSARAGLVKANVSDGWYYTCNLMKVWNTDEIVAAISHALDYGRVADYRAMTEVVLGVPGAGKTYAMMERLAKEYLSTGVRFLVISITGKAASEAIEKGLSFGMPLSILEARVMTLDKYLMHKKFPADLVCCDEFPMSHVGKIDAALSLAGATRVRLYGDGRQIPYDPFTAELEMNHSTIAGQVRESKITFMPKSHRLRADVCAAFLDLYPEIYPCDCCRRDEKAIASMSVERIGSIDDVRKQEGVRYHTYKQAERDQVIEGLRLEEKECGFKLMVNSGIGTVHQDQGSTHRDVVCLRLDADYDKKASSRNPSLYNRLNYVLTDMTRHTGSYVYKTASEEVDMVQKRIESSRVCTRLSLVREKRGMGLTTLQDMIANRYHFDITLGKSMD